MRPLLCVTVTAPTTAELRRRRDAVPAADLIELRLDSVSDPDVAGALAGRRRPVIVTCRPVWEGGRFGGSEEERRRLLAQALALDADYVDVEWRGRFDRLIAEHGGRRIVLSSHDFDGVPDDLVARKTAMQASGAAIVKIAARPRTLSDCIRLLEIGSRGPDSTPAASAAPPQGVAVIGMGDHGIATRVLAARFGSVWTYAGEETHMGQITARAMLDEYRFRAITEATAVYGVVGRPISHSLSPVMHNAAFAAAQMDCVYLPLPASDADDFVTFARAVGMKGASVTTPFKVDLFRHVDEASSFARRTGAINTLRMEGGQWTGENTDGHGFLAPLRRRVALSGIRAAVLGAGGAARAVAAALSTEKAIVTVHARNAGQARMVAALAGGNAGPWPPERGGWDLLINCTPVGMYPCTSETPIARELLTGRCVYDLVYNPPLTRLVREASAAGCDTIGGLDMLVEQAREQFHWWTGVRPRADVMRTAALKRLSELIPDEDHVV
jgi:3-dehydroquinate dehydratase/shikimate dehydrogenase